MSELLTYIDDLGDLLGEELATGSAESDPEAIPAIANESEMATLLGIAASQVRTKARDGVLIRAGRGRYDVRASLSNYLAQMRDAASRGGKPGQEAANAELKTESIRVKRAQADSIELKKATLRGELLDATAVERQWSAILRDVRAGMLAVPSRVGAKLPHLTAHDVTEIDREIRQSLGSLADGN